MSVKEVARGLCPPILLPWASRAYRRIKSKPETRLINGANLLLPPAHLLAGMVKTHPFYDTLLPEFVNFLRQESQSKLLVVDVGANVGDTAALVAARAGKDSVRFICIEADDRYNTYLRHNTGSLETELIFATLGDEPREDYVEVKETLRGTGAVVPSSRPTLIQTLDPLLVGRKPDIIKVDTDGFDNRILRGASRCLSEVGPHLYFEYSPCHVRVYGGEDPIQIFPFLRDKGYAAMIVYDSSGYPMCLIDLDSPTLSSLVHYADIKPGFYADLLISRDRDLLSRFYQADRQRFPIARWC
jgi:FkbM family methyltransferase